MDGFQADAICECLASRQNWVLGRESVNRVYESLTKLSTSN
jgi:hypothetical protein